MKRRGLNLWELFQAVLLVMIAVRSTTIMLRVLLRLAVVFVLLVVHTGNIAQLALFARLLLLRLPAWEAALACANWGLAGCASAKWNLKTWYMKPPCERTLMPSPSRGGRNISCEHDVMVSHVHRARFHFVELVSSLVSYLPMGPLDGPCGRSTFNRSAYNATLAEEPFA